MCYILFSILVVGVEQVEVLQVLKLYLFKFYFISSRRMALCSSRTPDQYLFFMIICKLPIWSWYYFSCGNSIKPSWRWSQGCSSSLCNSRYWYNVNFCMLSLIFLLIFTVLGKFPLFNPKNLTSFKPSQNVPKAYYNRTFPNIGGQTTEHIHNSTNLLMSTSTNEHFRKWTHLTNLYSMDFCSVIKF